MFARSIDGRALRRAGVREHGPLGLADLVMGLMGALGSAAGGMVLGAWGFVALNALGAAFVVGPLAAAWLLRPTPGARTIEPLSP